MSLKAENDKLKELHKDKDGLSREVRKLRDMLMESSFELEKCKDEFIKLGK